MFTEVMCRALFAQAHFPSLYIMRVFKVSYIKTVRSSEALFEINYFYMVNELFSSLSFSNIICIDPAFTISLIADLRSIRWAKPSYCCRAPHEYINVLDIFFINC